MQEKTSTDALILRSKDDLRHQLSRYLEDSPEDDDNLMDFGLSSISVMQLVGEWKKARLDVSFVEMAQNPTINGLWDLLQRKSQSVS